jgi:hypothetical protein
MDEKSLRIERQKTILVKPCFSHQLCDEIVSEAEDFQWGTQRHSRFPTTDIQVNKLVNTRDRINNLIKEKIYPWCEEQFKLPAKDMFLHDLFVVKYSVDGQRKLDIHRDVSVISFNVLLNEATDFDGGGTKFCMINKEAHIQKGEVVMHSGALYHIGKEITRGKRYIMVGFIGIKGDIVNRQIREETRKRLVSDEEMLSKLFL